MALNQFLDNRHQTPKWLSRPGLVGWDLFGQIDGQERRPEWLTTETLADREGIVSSWVVDMTTYMDTTESLRLGSTRLQWVDVYNLRRLKQQGWDPGGDGPSYVDLVSNRFIDYNLYTKYSWDRNQMWTEYPVEPFGPLQHYLGAAGDLGNVHCTLPEVIDFYRHPGGGGSRRGGFFSTEFFFRGWKALLWDGGYYPTPSPRRRQLSDCYHNYIWLAFATGSVGGPVPGPVPSGDYDLSGVKYVNPPNLTLNTYTDEILDSMLSLSRLTSLVRWKWVSDNYRPMRMTRLSSGPRIELRSTTSGLELPENAWLWSGASDGMFTVGWIVHNYAHNYNVPESVDGTTPVLCPKVHIYGLTQGVPLELAWFDDHAGQLIGNRSVTTTGQFTSVTVPATVPGGFWKSVAFVIQPVGLTPAKDFEPLPSYPNHMIGQIEVSPWTGAWFEEYQHATSGTLTFTARTKPSIDNMTNWRFTWKFDGDTTTVTGQNWVQRYCPASGGDLQVAVDIYDASLKRVSGDKTSIRVE